MNIAIFLLVTLNLEEKRAKGLLFTTPLKMNKHKQNFVCKEYNT